MCGCGLCCRFHLTKCVVLGAPPDMADAQRTAPPTPSPRREKSAHGSFGRPAGVLAEGRRSDSHTTIPPPRGRSPSLEYVTDPSGIFDSSSGTRQVCFMTD